MKPVIVIPAYQPGPELERLADSLLAAGSEVIIVDDGSSSGHAGVFTSLASRKGLHLLRHASNMGKGQALKTAFEHFLSAFPEASPGVVTADADGQHLPDDIAAVSGCLAQHPAALCLGVRAFQGSVPMKSLFGNTLTRLIFRLLSGHAVSDTQTGLRGIPRSFLPRLKNARAAGYAFELEMLLMAVRDGMEIREIPIKTIYIGENKGSHFNPLLDSMRVYAVFLRFAAASLFNKLTGNRL